MGGIRVGSCFQERRSNRDVGRRSSHRDVLVRGPENSLRHEALRLRSNRAPGIEIYPGQQCALARMTITEGQNEMTV
jgi:hypothetical protein